MSDIHIIRQSVFYLSSEELLNLDVQVKNLDSLKFKTLSFHCGFLAGVCSSVDKSRNERGGGFRPDSRSRAVLCRGKKYERLFHHSALWLVFSIFFLCDLLRLL